MLARVSETIARFRMCQPGERIGVACSGGPDSVALLEALLELAPALEITVGLAHLNHKLRGEASDQDEAFVRALAAKRGLELHVRSTDIEKAAGESGRNLEDAGRTARYGWFAELIEQGVYDRIATGHTLSDQAETVLFRLLRGAGPDGLSAIRPVRAPGVIRPLLGVERPEVEAFLTERGAEYRVDESNRDSRFARNRIRHNLLPELEQNWNPRVSRALARLGDQAAEDAAYWSGRVERWEARLLHATPDGLVLRADEVSRLEPALRRRLLRRALERVGGEGRFDFQHLEALRRLIEQTAAGARLSLPGLTVERSCGRVRLAAAGVAGKEAAERPSALDPPAEHDAPDGRTRIRFEVAPQAAAPGSYTNPNWDRIDWSSAPKPLVLRTWRPGDRIRLEPGGSERKLGDLLQAADVAVWDRACWPVLAARSESGSSNRVLWTRGFGASSEFRPSGNIGEVLRVFEFDEAGRPWTGPRRWGTISAGL